MEYQLNLTVEDGSAPVPPNTINKFPVAYSDAKLGNFYLLSPLSGEVKAYSNQRYHVGQRDQPWAFESSTLVMCKGNSPPSQMQRAEDGTYSVDLMAGPPGDTLVLGKLVSGGGWSGLFTFTVVN